MPMNSTEKLLWPNSLFQKNVPVDLHKHFSQAVTGCFLRFDEHAYNDGLFEHYGIVSPPQLHRAVTKRRAEYLAGRLCVKHCFALHQQRLQVPTGAHREPIWPEGMVGAITHARGLAGAVVAPGASYLGLGLDIEELVSEQLAKELSGQVLYADEVALCQASQHPYEHMFTRIFSAKESFFKAAYSHVGHYFDFHAVKAIAISKTEIQFQVQQPLCPEFFPGYQVKVKVEILDGRYILSCIELKC